MGKKRTRSATTSKGERRSIVNGVKEVRRARDPWQVALNKMLAWKKGLNPWITVPGPSKKEAWVKVRANTLYGDPKRASYGIFQGAKDE
jgi:hypothetical protein